MPKTRQPGKQAANGQIGLLMLDSNALVETNQLYDELAREQAAAHLEEMRELSDLAFVFLDAADGDRDRAAELFERGINLLYEGGTLQTWRYRLVLAGIREGL
jgi:hypothetical protein